MCKLLILLSLLVVVSGSAAAQSSETLTIKTGQTMAAGHGRLNFKFIAVTEDSRCPEGTTCIWAGNAKVKFEVGTRGQTPQTFELNTNVGSKGDVYFGWVIELVSLSAGTNGKKPKDPKIYEAKFAIKPLPR